MCRFLTIIASLTVLLLAASCSQQPKAPQDSATTESADKGTAQETAEQESNAVEPAVSAADASPTASAGDEAGPQPSPEEVIRSVADFYAAAKTIRVREGQVMHMQMQGIDNKMASNRTVVAEKPKRLAVRSDGGMMGIDLVSDGETLFTSMAMMKTYAEETAPESIEELSANPIFTTMGSGMGGFVLHLLNDDPYERMMEGVADSKYVGRETLGDVDVHHLSFTREQFDWEIWINAQGDPLVNQVSMDLAKAMAEADGQFQGQDMKATFVTQFTEWQFDGPVDSSEFVFTPPEGATKSHSLFGDFDMEDEPSPLLGEVAPPLELDLLDGGRMNLQDHADKEIVMLDFWATWCGPCVQEMPELAEVAEEYKDRQVVFYAVNQQEESDQISEFLNKKELDITVALDVEGDAALDYGVEGIPMLVLIDKAGVVQAVHIGYDPKIKSVLRQELDDLLAGKNLAEEFKTQRQQEEAAAAKPEGLEPVWSHDGRYSTVAVDGQQNAIFALKSRRQCEVLNAAGEIQRTFEIERNVTQLRPANLTPSDQTELLGYDQWGGFVTAVALDGTRLWTESGGEGIDDVWAADLDSDGQDEVIVGYNGGTGLHVFDRTGVRRWQYDRIGNVWHVAAGDVTGDGSIEVVTTSASGQVHLFDADGQQLKELDCSIYANMVRVGRVAEDDDADTIFVVGTGDNNEQLVALDGAGTELWAVDLPDDTNHCDSMAIARGTAWAAVGLRGGLVIVVDLLQGTINARAVRQGQSPQVNWATDPADDSPLLLVATGRSLDAYHVKPQAPGDTEDEPVE